ncbi:hypothetical protein B0H14DRAFT_3692386 [Mycena olivaceomarginata]|nr:hypothetical protein B0H14DRAFT_3692386 [Mycena olivaceomarginata]
MGDGCRRNENEIRESKPVKTWRSEFVYACFEWEGKTPEVGGLGTSRTSVAPQVGRIRNGCCATELERDNASRKANTNGDAFSSSFLSERESKTLRAKEIPLRRVDFLSSSDVCAVSPKLAIPSSRGKCKQKPAREKKKTTHQLGYAALVSDHSIIDSRKVIDRSITAFSACGADSTCLIAGREVRANRDRGRGRELAETLIFRMRQLVEGQPAAERPTVMHEIKASADSYRGGLVVQGCKIPVWIHCIIAWNRSVEPQRDSNRVWGNWKLIQIPKSDCNKVSQECISNRVYFKWIHIINLSASLADIRAGAWVRVGLTLQK